MQKISFLGLGAMGSRMALRLVEAGYDVTVWNRSSDATGLLAAKGARVAETPAQAADEADCVISMVRDDDASEEVWSAPNSGAVHGMKNGTLAVECSTVSVGHVRHMAKYFNERGVLFVDAPLAGSRPQAEAGTLIFFAGGVSGDVERLDPVLNTMGTTVHHCGAVGSGAAMKLVVNGLFGVQLAAVAELMGLGDRLGLDAGRAVEILGQLPITSPAAMVSAKAMLDESWAPAFPISLVAKDFGLLADAADQNSISLPLMSSGYAVYLTAEDRGFAQDNITGVVQLYR